ncbi:hypothetical protein AWL63_22860 [Sphingomonas panacis]|uniref:Uncharacterized protein n=2 Tax=Sphingomonas panacis TaxID=1560345 RepID=A0A1B3ZG13_9SPHN|nr:hypothetical protein AWL63_22860 [Sphingomonas panacis]
MLADMQIRAAHQPDDVVTLLGRFDELRVAGQIHPQPCFAAQRQIDVAIPVERQIFQPVEKVVALGRVAIDAPVFGPAGQVVSFHGGAIASGGGGIGYRRSGLGGRGKGAGERKPTAQQAGDGHGTEPIR